MDMLSSILRKQLNMPPYVLVSQYKKDTLPCVGKTFHTSRLYECSSVKDSTIVFLEEADGTEEIPSHHI